LTLYGSTVKILEADIVHPCGAHMSYI